MSTILHHSKHGLALTWILFASALPIECANHQPSKVRPRNVILISIDTLRADHLGCYGYPRDVSPTIDRLAEGGLVFEDVTAPSPWTLPSHASLLTGRYPSRHGLKSHYQYLPNHVDTIAGLLQSHEFETAAVINSHNVGERYGLDRGFDHFIYVEEHLEQATPSRVEDEAKKWLSTPKERPFFLFLHYYDVHSDYSSLPEYEQMFVGSYDGIADGTTNQLFDFRRGRLQLNRSDIQHLIDLYDAGIRQNIDNLTGTGEVLGTPAYMPPEQAGGEQARFGPTMDIYSLGAILYELLTGRPPFQSESTLDLILQVLNKDPVAPRLLNPSIPRDLQTICLKCLAKDPQRRYASAAALASDLGRWLNNQSIEARPISSLERGWRWCRRRPAVAGLSLAVVGAMIAGTTISLYYAIEANDQTSVAELAAQRANQGRNGSANGGRECRPGKT